MDTMDSKEILEAESCILDQVSACATSTAIRCAVQLGIADVISGHKAPVTHSDLLAQLSIPPAKSAHLYRLMRLLVHNRVFAMQKDGHGQEGYVLTSISKSLSNKSRGNFSALVLLMTDPVVISPGSSMANWFQNSTSTSAFDAMYGMNLYNYFGKHPDMSAQFNEAVGTCAELTMKSLVKDLKPMLEGFETLVDVGGNDGTVAKAIAEVAPHLKCTVYDLNHVISEVKDDTSGITFVAGDMFEFIPSADIIHFKSIFMDWGNEECLKILKSCKEAISRNDSRGMLVIIDCVVDATKQNSESVKSHSRLELDVYTMSIASGKMERTEMDWKELFFAAGFTSYKITPFIGFPSIIQVYP